MSVDNCCDTGSKPEHLVFTSQKSSHTCESLNCSCEAYTGALENLATHPADLNSILASTNISPVPCVPSDQNVKSVTVEELNPKQLDDLKRQVLVSIYKLTDGLNNIENFILNTHNVRKLKRLHRWMEISLSEIAVHPSEF